MTHFETYFNAVIEYALRHVSDDDMVGLTIDNEGTENQQKVKPKGFSFSAQRSAVHRRYMEVI
jgi:uncharacterized protein YukJ